MSRELTFTRGVSDPGALPRGKRETFAADNCRHGRSSCVDLISVTWTVYCRTRSAPMWEVSQYGARHEDVGWHEEIPGSAGIRRVQSEDGWPAGEEQPPAWFTEAARAFAAEEAANAEGGPR